MAYATSTEAEPLVRGARVGGKLELLHVIGSGGMATVWSARNLATGGKVAVKVLSPERRADLQAVARFRYEARLGATLNHRSITRVLDLVDSDDGSLVLVLELLRGETLDSYYQRKTQLSTREAVAIVLPLLSALQHAHELGIIHRDIKPSNIFLHTDPDGQVTPKLLDFGIAKAEASSIETKTGDALGTPQFMSPEQVRAGDLDGRSDLFSIAVVLYEIITGGNPFPGPTPTAVLAQVLEMEIDPDPAIDPRVWLELKRALSKNAYQRHGSAKELATALCSALGESEAALVATLRTDAPIPSMPPDDPMSPAALDHTPTRVTTAEMRRQTATRMSRRAVAVTGIVALLAVFAAVAFLRTPKSTTTTTATSTATLAAAPIASTPAAGATNTASAPVAVELPPDVPSPSSEPAVKAAPPKRPPVTTVGTKPKTTTTSVGRTPGF